MKKQILLSLTLLVAISCMPVQAAESKSGWTVFKNSAKILIGSYFVWSCSIRTMIDAATFDKEQARAEARQAREAAFALAHERGEANAEVWRDFQALLDETVISDRGSFGVWKLGWTAAGVAIIYSGVKGLTEEEPVKA